MVASEFRLQSDFRVRGLCNTANKSTVNHSQNRVAGSIVVANAVEFPVFAYLRAVLTGGFARPRQTRSAVTRTPDRRRLTAAEQWRRISTVLGKSIGDAERAGSLQTRAAQQLDLASYALYNLVDELALVMQAPLGRVRADVHHLEPALRLPVQSALAA